MKKGGERVEEIKNLFFGVVAGGLIMFMCVVVITIIIQTWRER